MTTRDRSIKLCFVCPKAYPLFNPQTQAVFGGAEVEIYLLTQELAKDERFAVSCVVADYGQPTQETRYGVRLIKSLSFRAHPLAGALKIWGALKRADADIYVQKTASLGTALVSCFCRRHHRPFVYRASHSNECDGKHERQEGLQGRLFVWGIRKAQSIILQTADQQRGLQKNYGLNGPMIPNGHALLPVPDVPSKQGVLWVGRSVGWKHPELLFKLARAFPDERFIMICPRATNDVNYDALRRAADQLDNLEFIERVSFDQIQTYFDRARVFVNTSDWEGFSNTFIQAGMAATPILSLQVDPDGFLARHQCGYCAQGDWNLFLEQFQRLAASENNRAMGDNARRYVETHHDITRNVEQFKQIFFQVSGHGDSCTACH